MTTTRVTRVETDSTGGDDSFVITLLRSESVYLVPDVEDLPKDVKDALTSWLAGKQP